MSQWLSTHPDSCGMQQCQSVQSRSTSSLLGWIGWLCQLNTRQGTFQRVEYSFKVVENLVGFGTLVKSVVKTPNTHNQSNALVLELWSSKTYHWFLWFQVPLSENVYLFIIFSNLIENFLGLHEIGTCHFSRHWITITMSLGHNELTIYVLHCYDETQVYNWAFLNHWPLRDVIIILEVHV